MSALPKTLGGLESRYVAIEEEILAAKQTIKKLEVQQREVLGAMEKLCTAQRIESHRGARYTFGYGEREFAQIEDWPRFLRYVAESESFDLVQKRVAVTAARERWNARETVPGIVRQVEREFDARALPGKAVR